MARFTPSTNSSTVTALPGSGGRGSGGPRRTPNVIYGSFGYKAVREPPNLRNLMPMKELHSQIEIDAPAERVWHLLTDFASYPQWNPFIRSISGEPRVGERLEVRIEP